MGVCVLAEAASRAQGSAPGRQPAGQTAAAVGLAAPGAPLCKGHQEPCVKKRVNKSGPNKGKHTFRAHVIIKACLPTADEMFVVYTR